MFRKAAKPTSKPADEKTSPATVTETAPCQRSVRLHVGRDVIAPIHATVLAEFQREAALPGFRKGKAPTELVQRQYTQQIQDETLHRVTKHAFEQVAKDHGLKPVGPFEIQKADYSDGDGLQLEATVEVEPTFALGVYKGIVLKREPVSITTEEVDKALAGLQESMAKLVPDGDAKEKQRQVPPLDDELAKDLGFQTLAQLRGHVEAKLREQKQKAQTQALEAQLCEALFVRQTFDVPSRLVARQTERLTRDFKVRLLLSGVAEAQVEQDVSKFTEQLRTSAERHVKLAFILDRIAAAESVAVTQDELVTRLWHLSQQWKKDPAEVRKLLDAQGLWPSVISTLRQEKTIALVMASATIEGEVVVEPPMGSSQAPAATPRVTRQELEAARLQMTRSPQSSTSPPSTGPL